MVSDTWLLMKLYWLLDRREVTSQSALRILGFILAAIGILFISVFSGLAGYGASFLTRSDLPVSLPLGLVPGLLLAFVLVGGLVFGMDQAVESLFLSGDLDRLMVAPVHTRSVMVAKLLSRAPSNLVLLLLFAAPAFVAYGVGIGAGPIYYLLGGVMLLMAPLFGLAVGAVIAMLLVQVLPVNRLNELLTAAYAFVGIAIALLAQLPRLFFDGGDTEEMAANITSGTLGAALETIERLPIPTFWAGRGLVALDAGRFEMTGVLGILAYFIVTLGLFVGIIMTADRLYLSGWLKTQTAGSKRQEFEESKGRFLNGSLAAAIGMKDWLMRLRDPRQMVSLLGGGFVAIVVGGLAIFRGSGGSDNQSLLAFSQMDSSEATGIVAVFLAMLSPGVLMGAWALFVGTTFLMNTATYALALEGRAFPLLKAAPIRPREVWSAKLWSIYVPFVLLFLAVLIGSRFAVGYDLRWLPYALVAGLIIGYGLLAISVSTGFRYALLGWTDPRRMLSSGGGLVSLLLSVVYGVPVAIIVLFGFALSAAWTGWSIPLALVALLLLAGLTWVTHLLMVRWADSAWDKLPV